MIMAGTRKTGNCLVFWISFNQPIIVYFTSTPFLISGSEAICLLIVMVLFSISKSLNLSPRISPFRKPQNSPNNISKYQLFSEDAFSRTLIFSLLRIVIFWLLFSYTAFVPVTGLVLIYPPITASFIAIFRISRPLFPAEALTFATRSNNASRYSALVNGP